MKLIKRAFETIRGYCKKHPTCKNKCIFYDSETGCIFQDGVVPTDWKIPEKISD